MEKNVRHNLGAWALMLTGLGLIIDSGWLFGTGHAAKVAGSAVIFTWVTGAIVIPAIAPTYSEPGATFPESGGMVRHARYSHGSLVGFVATWANWIAIVTVIPIEAEASIQYMSGQPWPWVQSLFQHGELMSPELVLSAVLVVVYFLLNYRGVKVFTKANNIITIFEFIIPAATAVALVAAGSHPGNFDTGMGTNVADQGPAPYGWSAMLAAIATSGTVLAFNDFQSPINLAGETHNPGRNIPIVVISLILSATVTHMALQVASLGAAPPESLVNGWHGIDCHSPFAQLVIALNLNWPAIVLYIDALVSPLGTGSTYMAITIRMIHAMERNNTMPVIFGRVYPLFGVPRPAMQFSLAVSLIFLFFLRGWGALAVAISVATVISYLMGPIGAMSLRRMSPQLHRPLRLPGLSLITPLVFVCASLILYWAKQPLTGEITVLTLMTLPVYFYCQAKAGRPDSKTELKDAWWTIAYLPIIAALSYCGSTEFDGHGYVPYGWDIGIVVMSSLFLYHWGMVSGWYTRYLDEVDSVHEETEVRDRKRGAREASQGV